MKYENINPMTDEERITLKIELYEKYKLKDGRIGWVVDILGHGEACMFELEKKEPEEWLITVTQDELGEKIVRDEAGK